MSSIVGALMVIGLNWRLFRNTFHLAWIVQTGAAVSAVCLLSHMWPSTVVSIGRSVGQITVGTAVFAGVLLLTRYFSVGELVVLRSVLSSSEP